jgi:hypothetical protein
LWVLGELISCLNLHGDAWLRRSDCLCQIGGWSIESCMHISRQISNNINHNESYRWGILLSAKPESIWVAYEASVKHWSTWLLAEIDLMMWWYALNKCFLISCSQWLPSKMNGDTKCCNHWACNYHNYTMHKGIADVDSGGLFMIMAGCTHGWFGCCHALTDNQQCVPHVDQTSKLSLINVLAHKTGSPSCQHLINTAALVQMSNHQSLKARSTCKILRESVWLLMNKSTVGLPTHRTNLIDDGRNCSHWFPTAVWLIELGMLG